MKFRIARLHKKNYSQYFPSGCWVFQQVCVSVCLSPLQSKIAFDPVVGSQPNVKGHLNSLQVIFKQACSVRPNPPKRRFLPIYLFPGLWGRGCNTFSEMGGCGKKCWEWNFDSLDNTTDGMARIVFPKFFASTRN